MNLTQETIFASSNDGLIKFLERQFFEQKESGLTVKSHKVLCDEEFFKLHN